MPLNLFGFENLLETRTVECGTTAVELGSMLALATSDSDAAAAAAAAEEADDACRSPNTPVRVTTTRRGLLERTGGAGLADDDEDDCCCEPSATAADDSIAAALVLASCGLIRRDFMGLSCRVFPPGGTAELSPCAATGAFDWSGATVLAGADARAG